MPIQRKAKKGFSKSAGPDMENLLLRMEQAKIACPLIGCIDTFGVIQKDLASINTKLDTFLGNGHEGLFQALEDKVSHNTERIYRLERLGYAMIAGLMVLNIALQVGIKFFWVRP